MLLGRGVPLHCNIEDRGLIYDCSWRDGCTISRVPFGYDPCATEEVVDAQLDILWFLNRRRFEIPRTILDVLGFLPAGRRPINCVQATALALGIWIRCRTPSDLLELLRRYRICSE